MTPTALMSIFSLNALGLRAEFEKHSGFLDAKLFELLKETDFTPDAWTILGVLNIPTAKDLIGRLNEIKGRDAGLSTHSSLIHSEFKHYLTSRGLPLTSDGIQPIFEEPRKNIGTIDCSQDTIHLISPRHLDLRLSMASKTCDSAPESRWHTKLTLGETTFNKTERELLLRQGDKVTVTVKDGMTPPLQIEHLGFEGTQASIRIRSNTMRLEAA